MNDLGSALHLLTDERSPLAPPDLADRVLVRARRRSQHRGLLTVVGAALAVVLVSVAVITTGQQQAAHRAARGLAASAPSVTAGPRVNELLIGSDSGPDRAGVRPDTLIVASIDTRTGATVLFGLPRNLEHVPFPAGSAQAAAYPHGWVCANDACQLNGLWAWAEGEGSRYYHGVADPGLTATTQAAEAITGLQVNGTVVVTMAGLQHLVDAVGGVDLTVHERLPIGGDAQDPHAGSWIEKGTQHLDGYQALWYARSRWSTDDYDRMARQQCLISALARQLDATTVITRFPQIAKALRGDLQTSIRQEDLAGAAALAARVKGAPIRLVGLAGRGQNVDPDYAAIRHQVAAALSSRGAQAGTTTGSPYGHDC